MIVVMYMHYSLFCSCEEDSDMDDDGNSEAFMAGAISLPLDGSATNENASGIVVDAGPNAFYEDDGYDDEGNGYYLGIQNKLDTGSAYISRPITPKGAGRSALFGRKNSTSIPGLVTSGSRASTPLPPIYASKSASRSLAGSRESKKTHRQLANQYTAQSPALSLESRLARQQELNALRFNASDNMFVPGGKAK